MIIFVPLTFLLLTFAGFYWLYTHMNLTARLSTISAGFGAGLYQVGGFLIPHSQWHEWHYAAGFAASLIIFLASSALAAWRANAL